MVLVPEEGLMPVVLKPDLTLQTPTTKSGPLRTPTAASRCPFSRLTPWTNSPSRRLTPSPPFRQPAMAGKHSRRREDGDD